MQASQSESKRIGIIEPHNLTEEQQDSPTDAFAVSLLKSKQDPDQQIQMSSVQSLVTLQGKPSNSKDDKLVGSGKELLSAGEIDDFSLFQQPMEGMGQQETDVNNTFQEINQSVDQVCEDDPDFQSILSNRIRAQLVKDDKQTEEQKNAAQEALLQKKVVTSEADSQSYTSGESQDNITKQQVAKDNLCQLGGGDGIKEINNTEQHVGGLMLKPSFSSSKQPSQNECSKTARMHNNQQVPFSTMMNALQSTAAQQRTSKSSNRQQKRPPISFALPTFSNEQNNSITSTAQQFELQQAAEKQNHLALQQNSGVVTRHQHNQLMQSLQQKLHINLKNLPSTSGGSSSYSNKDLSERLQGIIRQRNQGHLTTGVSPTLKPGSFIAWPNEGLEMDVSNRSGTERDDPMLLSGHGGAPIQAAMAGGTNMPPMPANLSQDPYFYLQWRQQKHKSCRSAHPNHQASYLLQQRKAASPGANARTLRLIQGKGGHKNKATNGQVNDSTSTFSNSSQTTVPVKSLTEVKNPSNLITFRFVNRKVTHLNEIGRFRNLTELDVNGNLLKCSVPELLNLPFLKKLNLSGNQITVMWSLPKTLEILNLSFNCLKKLDSVVMRSLSNLTTLEISNNGIESLEGIENATRLKRLIARNNQIQSLEPITNLKLLIEMDLENNPIDSTHQVLRAVQNKKDILLLNLKLAPLMVKIQNYDEFIASVPEEMAENKLVQDFRNLLEFLHNGTFYRRRKIYVRIRQQQQNLHIMERRFSNFSNDEDNSSNDVITTNQNNNTQSGGAFSRMQKNLSGSGSGTNPYRRANDKLPSNLGKNQRTNSTGLGNLKGMRPGSSNPQRSQRYEAIISLYDKLLEDEDKLLLQKKRKEARERKLQRKLLGQDSESNRNHNDYPNSMGSEEEDEMEDDLDASDLDDEDDLEDDLLSDFEQNDFDGAGELDADHHKGEGGIVGPDGDLLDDLQTYHNQHFGIELNASTADFNKEIKQINQQLMSEGHLVEVDTTNCKKQQLPKEVDTPPQATQTDSPCVIQSVVDDSDEQSSGVREVDSSDLVNESVGQDGVESVTGMVLSRQESSAYSDQIDAQEINVVVPIEERSSRYTNRQHHQNTSGAVLNTSGNKQQSQEESSVVRQPNYDANTSTEEQLPISQRSAQSGPKMNTENTLTVTRKKAPQLSFKLDLAKVKNNATGQTMKQQQLDNRKAMSTTNRGAASKTTEVIQQNKITPGVSVRNKPNQQQLISVRKIQNQIQLSQISERIPIKKSQNKSPQAAGKILNQSGTALETSYQSAQVVKKQELPLQQKQVHIPKLALQNIHRQPSEQSQNNNQVSSLIQQQPKSLKIMALSKRDDSMASGDQTLVLNIQTQKSLTIKQSQIVKTLQGKELLELYEKVDHQRKVINDVKRVLGDTLMTDHCIVDRIVALQDAQRFLHQQHLLATSQLINRHLMQIEDLNGQIYRLQQLEMKDKAMTITKPLLQQATFLDQMEKINESMMSQPSQIANKQQSSSPRPNESGAGGLTLRLKDIRQAAASSNNTGQAGVRTTEQQAMLELLKQSSCETKKQKLAKTGRIQNNNHVQVQAPQMTRQPLAGKTSGRNSRRDSGHTMELSSKREYMDQLCQSPTGPAATTINYDDTNTLERASNQDDILGTGGAASKEARKRKQRIVSDFNPGPLPNSDEALQLNGHELEDRGKQGALDDSLLLKLNSQQERVAAEKDDSFRRVGFFLEKIKERNSSLQERLNLSFKKTTRLDQSSISYRPTTSFGNKKQALRGTLIERECISLTRDLEQNNGKESTRPQQQSKTPNILLQQQESSTGQELNENDSHQRLLNWDGRKPQLVRQMPAQQQHNSQNQSNNQTQMPQMSKQQSVPPGSHQLQQQSLVSPTNNYIDFLQTGKLDMNTAAAKKSQQFSQRQGHHQTKQQTQQAKKTALSVFEETNNQLQQKQKNNSTNVADQTGNGPLFSFYQCTEVLQQLSSTSRGAHHQTAQTTTNNQPHSSKNRNMIQQRGCASGDYLQQQPTSSVASNIQKQYSSLLDKQRSNNAMPISLVAKAKNHHQSSSLLEHATITAQMTKQSTSFIQRANSLEMVPRLSMPKHNNYLPPSTTNEHQQQQQQTAAAVNNQVLLQREYGTSGHHVRPNSGSGSNTNSTAYWTVVAQQQQLVSDPEHSHQMSRNTDQTGVTILANTTGGAMANKVGGSKTTTAASAAMHVNNATNHNNLLNKSLQTYQRHSKGLLNNSTVVTKFQNIEAAPKQKTNQQWKQQKPKSCNTSSRQVNQNQQQKKHQQQIVNKNILVEKLQLQLKGLTQQQQYTQNNPQQRHHHQQNNSTGKQYHMQHNTNNNHSQRSSKPGPHQQQVVRKAMQTDRARYQSSSNNMGNMAIVDVGSKAKSGSKAKNTVSQTDNNI